jgi:hypothetical protein
MKSYTDVDALEGQEDVKQEGKELKRIFLDLVKENKEVQQIMNGALQNEQFVYDMFKYHDKAIKNNATI